MRWRKLSRKTLKKTHVKFLLDHNNRGDDRVLDPFAIAALAISIISVIFVIVREGISLTLGYRESETCQRMKTKIDESLKKYVKEEFESFMETKLNGKYKNELELLSELEKLGYMAYLARDATSTILDNITNCYKAALTSLGSALSFFVLTIVWGVFYWNIRESTSTALLGLIAFLAIIYSVNVWKNLKNYYFIRERFLKLSETPTMKKCMDTMDELSERGLS